MEERELLRRLQELAAILEEKYGYSATDLATKISSEDNIPLSVFSTDLSPLQAIVTFLHDHQQLAFNTIAETLRRSYRAVWGAYQKEGIAISTSKYLIPIDCFDDKHSILECVVKYLKLHHHLKFTEIARQLHKDPRTVWTVWNRAKNKDAQAS